MQHVLNLKNSRKTNKKNCHVEGHPLWCIWCQPTDVAGPKWQMSFICTVNTQIKYGHNSDTVLCRQWTVFIEAVRQLKYVLFTPPKFNFCSGFVRCVCKLNIRVENKCTVRIVDTVYHLKTFKQDTKFHKAPERMLNFDLCLWKGANKKRCFQQKHKDMLDITLQKLLNLFEQGKGKDRLCHEWLIYIKPHFNETLHTNFHEGTGCWLTASSVSPTATSVLMPYSVLH